LGFGFVFAQSQAATGAPSLSLAKTPKFLAAEWPQYFFKRSRAGGKAHGQSGIEQM
jgi:hypothetical protein